MSTIVAGFRTTSNGRQRARYAVKSLSPALITVWIAFALVLGLSVFSAPRRTGDAHQYIAMGLQLSRLQSPSLSPAEETAYRSWLEAQSAESGFPNSAPAVRQPALVAGGRQEFSHFWFFPLLAAPLLVLTDQFGLHPLTAFTLLNGILLTAALAAIVQVFSALPALAILASPLAWFVARAQVEVFSFTFLTLAIAAAARGRWGWATVAIAVASTQNAPIAAVIPLLWIVAAVEWMRENSARASTWPHRDEMIRASGWIAMAGVIALLHPIYYLHQLGVLTPQQLNGGIAGSLPAARKLLAPLFDSNIGFLWWLPLTTLVSGVGLAVIAVKSQGGNCRSRAQLKLLLIASAIGCWFLFVFAQTTNVNSGGTVHLSRYALWLLPLTLPALAAAGDLLNDRAHAIALVSLVVLFALYLGYFRPDQPERYVEHSPQATWLMAHAPQLFQPLPEIFVERTLHIDGGARASAADASCRIVFIASATPRQPCAMTDPELQSVASLFNHGEAAVWVRREANGASTVAGATNQP